MFIVIIAFFILTVLFRIIFKNKEINSKYINYFKFLFPSWCFFDESTDTPYLFYKINNANYQPLHLPKKVSFINLFHNAYMNFYHYFHSNMQQLLDLLYQNQNNPNFNLEESIEFKIAQNFVRSHLKSINYQGPFQFKFSYVELINNSLTIKEDIFETKIYDTNI